MMTHPNVSIQPPDWEALLFRPLKSGERGWCPTCSRITLLGSTCDGRKATFTFNPHGRYECVAQSANRTFMAHRETADESGPFFARHECK